MSAKHCEGRFSQVTAPVQRVATMRVTEVPKPCVAFLGDTTRSVYEEI
jgi:hypothetical protein